LDLVGTLAYPKCPVLFKIVGKADKNVRENGKIYAKPVFNKIDNVYI